jgi:L1 cell adhesion molecule like protein
MNLFERQRPEAQYIPELRDRLGERIITKKLEKDMEELEMQPSAKSTLRKKHCKHLKSLFHDVVDENELRVKHEVNKKLVIDDYIAQSTIGENEKEAAIETFSTELDEDFDAVLAIYKFEKKDINSENKKAIESAKFFYVKEMDKHFVERQFIIPKELQDIHEKYSSLAHDRLKEELSVKREISRISEQLNQIIENIYEQYKSQNLMNVPIKQAIGIDLGTTYSCVGVMNRGKVHIISNKHGTTTTPSYVSFTKDAEVIVGTPAKDIAFENPYFTIFDVKRMIGRNYSDENIQKDLKLWPFEVKNINNLLKIKCNKEGTFLYPEEISAKILKKLKEEAEDYLEYEVKNAVITVPAYFNDAQRRATKDAGALAGLSVLQILNEPTAAAIAYSHQIKDNFRKNVLIYDLGGGTFDVAFVVIDNMDIDVRAVNGDTHLGGNDFDQRLLSHFYKKYEDKFGEETDEKDLKRALARLRIHCERKKWVLSEVSSTTIAIDVLLNDWDFHEVFNQSEFENLCMDLFEKTIEIVDKTLKCAKIDKSEIDDIVLIGGSTYIPFIRKLLRDYFDGKPLNKEIKPDEAVAYGATIQAALLNGEKLIDSNHAVVRDVSPYSLGIEVIDESMSVIIPRNSKIPVVLSKKFCTTEDNQTSVLIEVFEGEEEVAQQNSFLGEFFIEGLPKKPAGEVEVDVTMEIDKEGILHVKGETSDKSENITIRDHRGRIPPEELKMLINRVHK